MAMKFKLACLLFISALNVSAVDFTGETWKIERGTLKFISEAPHEKINGFGNTPEGFVNLKTGQVSIKFKLTSLSTKLAMRDEHMHENYLESGTYPYASFEGKIIDKDSKTGQVNVNGTLEIHGIKKENVVISGIVSGSDSNPTLKANFKVMLSDYNIKIPKLVFMKLNNEILIEIDFVFVKGK